MWWKKKLDLRGSAFFKGALPPSLESLRGLARTDCEIAKVTPNEHEIWAATLMHRAWGRARISAPRETLRMPAGLIEFGSGMTPAEREQIARDAQSRVLLELTSEAENVLRERKRLLHFLAAVLGDDGVAGLDLLAQLIWTPARLADENAHDAPLDIIQIHVLHVVTQPDGVWLHSHGLSELGALDFDVLRPAQALLEDQFDVLRSIAYAIVEGAHGGTITPIAHGDKVALVDAATFMAAAAPSDCRMRDPEGHTERRVVCCDPDPPGFFARMFGARGVRPSRLLSHGMIEGRHLIGFSAAATELVAERARESLALFERLTAEFADLQCSAVAKLGYATDGGQTDDREHLWFEVHGVYGDEIDATLLNAPFAVSRLEVGARGRHSVELLSDWAIMTPLGKLTPRNPELARSLRELRPEILESFGKPSLRG